MTLKRGAIYTAIGLTFAGLWIVRRIHDTRINAGIHSAELSAEDQVKVIVDPAHHSISTVTRDSAGNTRTTATFLPNTGASVELRKNGSAVVTAPKWGTELNPFMGLAFGSDIVGRAALGVNALYWQRLELGGGLLVNTSNVRDARVFVGGTYNVYNNLLVGLAMDNQKTAHLLAGLRF